MKNVLILLNYNDYKTTSDFLHKVKEYKNIDKIVVVDNCSLDNSFKKLKKFECKKIDVIENNHNSGYAAGNNYGIKYAIKNYTPDNIIVSNPDVIFEDNVVKIMEDYLLKNKKVGMIAPQMKNNKIKFYKYDFVECIISLFLILGKFYKSSIPKDDIWIPGSLFMMPVKVYNDIDCFDENTFLYCEEAIISRKLESKNYKLKILKNIEYIHNHSVTIKKIYKSKMIPFNIYYKSLYYYCCHYLNINWIQKVIFKLFYSLAYCERLVYDMYCRFNSKKYRKKI